MNSFLIQPGQNNASDTEALRKRQAVAQALMQPPQGIGDGIASLGQAMLYRQQNQNAMFPTAPGGAKPSFMTAMRNMFTGGNNRGAY
jgi:hypothetical protein